MMTRERQRGIAGQIAAAMAILAVAFQAKSVAADSLDGYWMDSDGEVILEIGQCGNARCGRVAWLRKPLGPDGRLLLDYRNPDPKLQKRPVCGLEVVSGFKKQPDGIWSDGTVYVSDLGQSFSGYAEILNPTQVKVTGYVILPLFGASEVWTKVSHPFPHCEGKDTKSAMPKSTTKTVVAPQQGANPKGDGEATAATR